MSTVARTSVQTEIQKADGICIVGSQLHGRVVVAHEMSQQGNRPVRNV